MRQTHLPIAAPPHRPSHRRCCCRPVTKKRRLWTRIAKFYAARLGRRERRLGALRDRLAFLFSD